eukprot:1862980-Prymnesium_polylepis.1
MRSAIPTAIATPAAPPHAAPTTTPVDDPELPGGLAPPQPVRVALNSRDAHAHNHVCRSPKADWSACKTQHTRGRYKAHREVLSYGFICVVHIPDGQAAPE